MITTVNHKVRKYFGLSVAEYCVLDYIYYRGQAGKIDVNHLINIFDISKAQFWRIKKKLLTKNLIQKTKYGTEVTKEFHYKFARI